MYDRLFWKKKQLDIKSRQLQKSPDSRSENLGHTVAARLIVDRIFNKLYPTLAANFGRSSDRSLAAGLDQKKYGI